MKHSWGKKAAWVGILFSVCWAVFVRLSQSRSLQALSSGILYNNKWLVARRNSPHGSVTSRDLDS